jgi:hypothetical protein
MNKISAIVDTGKLLVSDGAWGTYLFKKGLSPVNALNSGILITLIQ